MLTNFKKSLLAVLLGNLIYFGLLERLLPPALRHRPQRIDLGLLVDGVVCLLVLAVVEWWTRRKGRSAQPERES